MIKVTTLSLELRLMRMWLILLNGPVKLNKILNFGISLRKNKPKSQYTLEESIKI